MKPTQRCDHDRRQDLRLAPAGRHRQVPRLRRDARARSRRRGAEIVTVAIRRTNIGQNANEPSLLDALPPSKFTLLPNTAGCYTADDAVRTLRLARELLDGHELVKLEVLGDPQTLYPNMPETLQAAEDAGEGRLQGDGLQLATTRSMAQAARGDRLRRGDAARLADRLGHGHPQPLEPAAHHREREGAGASSMPASAPPPTPRSRWSWAATAC